MSTKRSAATSTADGDLQSAIDAALRNVYDPEIPTLSVLDLGMVLDVVCREGTAHVKMIPTFVGCPALSFIQKRVEQAVLDVDGVVDAEVEFDLDGAWTTERISEAGREKLREFGIAPPQCSLREMQRLTALCPYCGSSHTRLENLFGPTACRSVFYCEDCRQPFEAMKPV